MSTSVVFNISVTTSAGEHLPAIEAKFASFLKENSLSNDLTLERVERDGAVTLRASSPWALGVARAGDWVPKAQTEFEQTMHAVDPSCTVSFRTRYPDFDEPLQERLRPSNDGTAESRSVFFFFDGEDDHVPANAPIRVPRANVWELSARLFLPGDFFGLIDDGGRTLQAVVEPDNRVWVEIPAPEQGGSYGRFMDRRELHALLRALPIEFTSATVPGLTFAS